jgi:hypothetical protein
MNVTSVSGKRIRKPVTSYAVEAALKTAKSSVTKESSRTRSKRTKKVKVSVKEEKQPVETMFSSGEYNSYKTTFIMGVEKDADHTLYEVRLHWNPPKRVEWSCNCGQKFGILSRNHCKHIQAIYQSMTPQEPSISSSTSAETSATTSTTTTTDCASTSASDDMDVLTLTSHLGKSKLSF